MMKVVAHPLVVAVALGLVGPQVLEDSDADVRDDLPCDDGTTVSEAPLTVVIDKTTSGLHPSAPDFDWTTQDAPTSEEFDRVAAAFDRARRNI